jgi:uncharacterized membrane protein
MSEIQRDPTPFEPKPASSEPVHASAPHSAAPSGATPAASSHEQPHRLLAACSYLGVLFVIPLLAEKDDEFVKFHLRQGIALFLVGVVASFGFHWRRGGSMLELVVIVFSLVAAWRAWKGKRWTLPLIGKYAAKISL